MFLTYRLSPYQKVSYAAMLMLRVSVLKWSAVNYGTFSNYRHFQQTINCTLDR